MRDGMSESRFIDAGATQHGRPRHGGAATGLDQQAPPAPPLEVLFNLCVCVYIALTFLLVILVQKGLLTHNQIIVCDNVIYVRLNET